MPDLRIESALIGRWDVTVIQFVNNTRHLTVPVFGLIANSIPTSPSGKRRLVDWKQNVAETVKAYRGMSPWDSSDHYAISIGYSFCLQAHGNQELDVENFIKPTFDALAAGLFCTNDQDVSAIVRYDYDDSNFRYLFMHRLDDAGSLAEEGVGINVSVER